MSIGIQDIQKFTIDAVEMEEILYMAERAELGGSSNIYKDSAERLEKLPENQIDGQIGQFVGIKYLYGHTHLYTLARWHQNQRRNIGDGGHDIPGANVDFKASRIRKGDTIRDIKALDYRLAVRPKERHPGWVYIQVLVSGWSEQGANVRIMGWAREDMLPSQVEKGGPFDGAFILPCKDLHPLPPIRFEWRN